MRETGRYRETQKETYISGERGREGEYVLIYRERE